MAPRSRLALFLIPFFALSVGCGKSDSANQTQKPANATAQNPPSQTQVPTLNDLNKKIQDEEENKRELEQRVAALEGATDKNESQKKANSLEQVAVNSVSNDQRNVGALDALNEGETIPFFVLVYGDPSTANFSGIRRQIQGMDARPDIDENREREFTGFPYTVQLYVISLKSSRDYKELSTYAQSRSRARVIIFPIEKFKVQTYLNLTYTKSIFSGVANDFFWIGSSPEINVYGDQFSKLKLSNVSSYVPYLGACHDISKECFTALLDQGYFQQLSIINQQNQYPFHFVRSELAESEYLRNNKWTGDYSITGKGWLNRNFDRHLVSNITLSHEVWVSNKGAEGTEPSAEFFKVTGADKRPVCEKTDVNETYCKLPVQVPTVELPLEVRNDAPKIGMITSELVWTFDKFNMEQNSTRSRAVPETDSNADSNADIDAPAPATETNPQ